MSIPNIDNSAFSVLKSYVVLSSTGITITPPNTLTVTNGVYGSALAANNTGTFVGTQDSSANVTTAQTQLTAFVGNINTYANTNLVPAAIPTTPTITFNPLTNYFAPGGITFSGNSIILDANGNPDATFYIRSGSSIIFNNVPSISLRNGANACNVFWVAGSAITFTGTMPANIPGIFIAQSQITFANAVQTVGHLYAQTANITFIGNSFVTSCVRNVVCYAKGSLILTKKGYVPVENIRAGNMVLTKGKINDNSIDDDNLKMEHVIWASKYKINDLTSKTRPICIKKNALGENRPFRDLVVSPEHGLIVNGKMIAAKKLVDGKNIYQDTECNSVEYYHLECEKHSAIFANGILAESYLDINNRDIFDDSVRLYKKYLKNGNKMGKIFSLRV